MLAAIESLNWATETIAISTVAAAGIALIAAFIALRGFFQSRTQARQARAHHYLERYNGHLHIQPRTRLHTFFTIEDHEEAERIEEWESMSFENKLLTVQELNFWEELSGMYNRKLVDRGIIDDYFGYEALYIWKKIEWFVMYQSKSQHNAMNELRCMCKTIRHRREQAELAHLPPARTAQSPKR